jgi:hypothetical protein
MVRIDHSLLDQEESISNLDEIWLCRVGVPRAFQDRDGIFCAIHRMQFAAQALMLDAVVFVTVSRRID